MLSHTRDSTEFGQAVGAQACEEALPEHTVDQPLPAYGDFWDKKLKMKGMCIIAIK